MRRKLPRAIAAASVLEEYEPPSLETMATYMQAIRIAAVALSKDFSELPREIASPAGYLRDAAQFFDDLSAVCAGGAAVFERATS